MRDRSLRIISLCTVVVDSVSLSSSTSLMSLSRANLLAPLLNTFDFDDAVGTLVAEKEAVLTCNSVYGVQSGDTCAGVIQMFSLDAVFFSVINPNLNCDKNYI